MDIDPIVSWRLLSQQLTDSDVQTVAQVVGGLGGVQAQEYHWAKWSIGLRLRNATDAAVERAIAERAIVRTWAFRGTLHFVAAADVGWLLDLLSPAIIAANQRRYRQLELDQESFVKSQRAIAARLAEGRPLTRSQLAASLEAAGVSAAGQRSPYILQRAALDGLICHGPPRGREPAYVLLQKPAVSSGRLDRDEALARLAQRYLTGHGPASIRDLAWWSGLPMADVRQAVDAVSASLVRVEVGGIELWAGSGPPAAAAPPEAHLLPPFDEYLLGYRDRAPVLERGLARKVNAGGGMFKPAILVRGQVAGTWKRSARRDVLQIATELFRPLDEREMDALRRAAQQFGAFNGRPVEM
jgi:hypothetical protein